jgi:phage-related protein
VVRRVLAADEKPLHWVGFSKRDFLSLPAAVKEDMGITRSTYGRSER